MLRLRRIVYRVSQQFFVLNSVIRRSLQTWQGLRFAHARLLFLVPRFEAAGGCNAGYREWENAFRMACCCFRCCRPRQVCPTTCISGKRSDRANLSHGLLLFVQYTPRETVPERSQTRSRSTMPSTGASFY